MAKAISSILVCLLAGLSAGSLLNLSDHPHWFIRGWDFPRVQIVVLAWLLMLGITATCLIGGCETNRLIWVSLVIASFLTIWHGYRIYPYTPFAATQAKSTRAVTESELHDLVALRVVVSNIEKENKKHDHWMQVMRDANPDLLIVLEPDRAWCEAISTYTETFPHTVIIPRDNHYGIMLLSKIPIKKYEVRYIVQEDVPSIDAELQPRKGSVIRVVAVHPRPPEPLRDTNAVARDAELTLWGKELAGETRPVIIGGDLNDVAWSPMTRLFLRTSKLLDPRRGRGMFNTFHAGHMWMRFPLDHLFFSADFTVTGIQRLANVGSDHFPLQVDLHHVATKKDEHHVMQQQQGDGEEVEERVERAIEDGETDGEAVEAADPDRTGEMFL